MRMVKQWNRLPREMVDGNIPGRVECSSEPPALIADVPACCQGLDWAAFKDPFHSEPFYNSPEWSISHKHDLVGACSKTCHVTVMYCQTIFILHICCFPSLFHHPRLSHWQSCFVFSCCDNTVQGRSILCVKSAVPLQNSYPGAQWGAWNLGSREWRCDFTACQKVH